MITLYLNHFRGFDDTFIPLEDVSFLVGENSTGKTSVLTALRVLCGHTAWLSGRFQVGDEVLGGFSDFASNGVPWFQVGYIRHAPTGGDAYDALLLTFTGSGSKIPGVVDVRLRTSQRELRFHDDGDPGHEKRPAEGDADETFRRWVGTDPMSTEGLSSLPSESSNSFTPVHMVSALYASEMASYMKELKALQAAMLREVRRQAKDFRDAISERPAKTDPAPVAPTGRGRRSKSPSPAELQAAEPPAMLPLTMDWVDDLRWLAPIRAKPRRSYDTVPQGYSPEGDHVPWRLRRLSDKSRLRQSIRGFGLKSGLYDDIETRKFGDTEDAPFELRVRLGDRAPNLVNVGYGVSQALQVVASIAEPSLGAWFALQQPEVHLHPRAQAALGELLFESALPPQHKHFLVETHSDFVIDRFRHRMRTAAAKGEPGVRAQVLFFERVEGKNVVHRMQLASDGEYPEDQPAAFRAFFLEEEMKNLGY